MSMEILSPAGDMDSLKMAVYNGADEVYLGVKEFNARNIEGFNLESLETAVKFAHLFGVRVFLTVNILFTDEELQSAVDLVIDAYNLGVDAFIIQDLGLASILHDNYPMIELHASTQMGIHNLEGVRAIEGLGFKRVVLARESSLTEIKRIRENSKIEIEYFVHGALCVSFSGNCYMSSYLHDASGNRGKCKQLCRLPYTFKFNEKKIKEGYLLSAKDFNMIDRLQDLESAGVNSLKIEGRARRPYYVGVVTREYRKALDGLEINNEDLELAFNRTYTEGYFNGNGDIISNKQNHIGIKVGEVIDFKQGKKFNEIFVKSDREISAKSALKFYSNGQETATISAYDIQKKGDLFRITTTQEVSVGSEVRLISDFAKENELLNATKKISVSLKLVAKIGKKIECRYIVKGREYTVFGDECVESKSAPITHAELVSNFSKSEYFEASINSDLDNVFMPKRLLNEFRRKVYEDVYDKLIHVDREKLSKIYINQAKSMPELEDYQVIRSIDEEINNMNVIYSPEEYRLDDILYVKNSVEKQNKNFILNLPNYAESKDVDFLKSIVEKHNISVLINNVYGLTFNVDKYIGGGMNVYNSFTASYLGLPYISAENSEFKMPYMTLRHCPMKAHMKGKCEACPYQNGYKYVLDNGKTFNLKRIKLNSCTFYLD